MINQVPRVNGMHENTKILMSDGSVKMIKELYALEESVSLLAINHGGKIIPTKVHRFIAGN